MENKIGEFELNRIYGMDCLEGLKKLPEESIDLAVVDPPYYFCSSEKWDRQWSSFEDYLHWMDKICKELARVLRKGGSLYLFGYHKIISYIQVKILDRYSDLFFQNYLTWVYTMGVSQDNNFSNKQEAILFYSKKGKEKTFNSSSIRVRSQRQITGDKRAGQDGKVPDNWFLFNRLPGNSKERTNHPTQKPLELIKMLIKASSNKGDTILDVFSGSGTIAVSSKQLGRNFIGFEINKKYNQIISKRLAQQTLF